MLHRLLAYGLIQTLPRRVGGFTGGSASNIWFLSGAGRRIVDNLRAAVVADDSTGHPAAGSTAPARVRQPATRFVDHWLAVAEAHLRLIEASAAGGFQLSEATVEPFCWRTYLDRMGSRLTLKPDLGVVTRPMASGYEDRWFLEVDLGSEHPPTVLRKCEQYSAYRRTGQEEQRYGVFPLVVWVTQDDTRAATLRRAIRASRTVDRDLFYVVTIDELTQLVADPPGVSS